jgi:hypothetical protein
VTQPIAVPALDEAIAVVRNSDDLVEAFRKVKAVLGLSNQFCDMIGGLTTGHTDKILGPSRMKSLSPMTLDLFLELFAVELHMVINVDAAQRMAARWEGRENSNVRIDTKRLSKAILERAKPIIHSEAGRKGGLARNNWPLEKRSGAARKAAKSRWRKQRARERAERTAAEVVVS